MPRGKIARSDSRERRLEKERKHVEQKDIVAIKICSKFSVIDMEKKIIVISFIDIILLVSLFFELIFCCNFVAVNIRVIDELIFHLHFSHRDNFYKFVLVTWTNVDP